MSDYQYVKIVSWHVVRTHTRALDGWITLCGRSVRTMNDAESLPLGAKSCEVCLRIAVKRGDPGPTDTDAVPEE